MNANWDTDEVLIEAYNSGVASSKLGYSKKANPFGWESLSGELELSTGMSKHFDNWNKGWDFHNNQR